MQNNAVEMFFLVRIELLGHQLRITCYIWNCKHMQSIITYHGLKYVFLYIDVIPVFA